MSDSNLSKTEIVSAFGILDRLRSIDDLPARHVLARFTEESRDFIANFDKRTGNHKGLTCVLLKELNLLIDSGIRFSGPHLAEIDLSQETQAILLWLNYSDIFLPGEAQLLYGFVRELSARSDSLSEYLLGRLPYDVRSLIPEILAQADLSADNARIVVTGFNRMLGEETLALNPVFAPMSLGEVTKSLLADHRESDVARLNRLTLRDTFPTVFPYPSVGNERLNLETLAFLNRRILFDVFPGCFINSDNSGPHQSPTKRESRRLALTHAVESLTIHRKDALLIDVAEMFADVMSTLEQINQNEQLDKDRDSVIHEFSELYKARTSKMACGQEAMNSASQLMVLFLCGGFDQ